MPHPADRLPTFYLPHGGGPCFFMDWPRGPAGTWDSMAAFLRGLIGTLAQRPRAVVVVSGHWEEQGFAVNTAPRPALLFDYYGFPPHTYQLSYPVAGDPALAARVRGLLEGAGLATQADDRRGLDHGVFIPFMLVLPEPDVPFDDPPTLHLPTNMSAVVGPNGCGKSNIIDAIRWVMGESAASRLRGDSLTDVIFSGSSARKPVGQAVVELIFDNSDGTVTGEYAHYNEISVKRLVSRDGLSQYFLNGTRCRRRDITDLFLGTGLGPRSYSIIEQGMISQIVESDPEQLRVHLEEAAGISRYKERRARTQGATWCGSSLTYLESTSEHDLVELAVSGRDSDFPDAGDGEVGVVGRDVVGSGDRGVDVDRSDALSGHDGGDGDLVGAVAEPATG